MPWKFKMCLHIVIIHNSNVNLNSWQDQYIIWQITLYIYMLGLLKNKLKNAIVYSFQIKKLKKMLGD